MSDTNLNDASFTPEIQDSEESTNKQTYSATGSFRFWCQKVLPLVYDDSLSYYELLCKVVNYLNSVIQNVDNLNTSVDNTNTAFNNLQNYVNTTKDTLVEAYSELEQYVNNYFNNLDVQEEINAKLDAMASDGSLSGLISPLIPSLVAEWLSENITPTSPAIDASLSISGAGADAKVTGEQINELKSNLYDIVEPTKNLNNQTMGRWRARQNGTIENSNNQFWGMRDMIPCTPDTSYTVSVANLTYTGTLHIFTTWFDANKNVISQVDKVESNLAVTNTSPANAAYIYANTYNGNGINYTDASTMQIEVGTEKTQYVPPYAPKGVAENSELITENSELISENTELLNSIYKTETVNFAITSGYISNTTGRITGTSTAFKSSDYISLANVHRIVCNSESAYDYAAAIAFYEQSKTYISGITLTSGAVIANMEDFPNNAYYARICVPTNDNAVMYSIDTMEQKIQSVINSDREERYDVNFIKGKYIQLTTGTEAPSVDWKVSPFIDVDDLYSVTVKSIRNTNVSYISFYDSNKAYISGVLPTSETEVLLYKGNFPENTKYVRLCISDTDATAYCHYTYANNSFKNTLKYMCFGDSITSDEVCGIGTIIAQELNAIQLGNFAHGNATLSDWHTGNVNDTVETPNITPDTAYNANVLSNQVRNALAYATETGQPVTYTHPVAGTITLNTSIWSGTGSEDNKPDIIYIAIGTNDGGDETPVVDNANTINQQEYANLDRCGYASSLRWALETLIAKFPYAEIFVATPLHTAEHRMNGKRSYDIMNMKADIIKNVCRFCSVNVIDAYANSGVSSAMEDEFFGSDGLHPVEKWRGYIARYVANKIKQNYIQRP